MPNKHVPLAICYDFDGTLAAGNMQERRFIPEIGTDTDSFWTEVKRICKAQGADEILAYMKLMLDKAQSAQVKVRKKDFEDFGKDLNLFPGVFDSRSDNWFKRITEYGRESGVQVEHFIISSGIREIVQGTPIAKYFSKIYASSFMYDHHGVASWPALCVNYTNKTQYLFRINKGSLDVYDNDIINKYVPMQDRPVPFSNIVFIGDGITDIPCFRTVKDLGGHAIAVYKGKTKGAKKKANDLLQNGRVNFVAPADYNTGKTLDRIAKCIIEKVSSHEELRKYASAA